MKEHVGTTSKYLNPKTYHIFDTLSVNEKRIVMVDICAKRGEGNDGPSESPGQKCDRSKPSDHPAPFCIVVKVSICPSQRASTFSDMPQLLVFITRFVSIS
jgi:hypothetical protein